MQDAVAGCRMAQGYNIIRTRKRPPSMPCENLLYQILFYGKTAKQRGKNKSVCLAKATQVPNQLRSRQRDSLTLTRRPPRRTTRRPRRPKRIRSAIAISR
jgi:hypothetical protein